MKTLPTNAQCLPQDSEAGSFQETFKSGKFHCLLCLCAQGPLLAASNKVTGASTDSMGASLCQTTSEVSWFQFWPCSPPPVRPWGESPMTSSARLWRIVTSNEIVRHW